jgi:hypothetical protein
VEMPRCWRRAVGDGGGEVKRCAWVASGGALVLVLVGGVRSGVLAFCDHNGPVLVDAARAAPVTFAATGKQREVVLLPPCFAVGKSCSGPTCSLYRLLD